MTMQIVDDEFDLEEDTAVPSIYLTENSSTAKYDDSEMIVCRAPLGNNHICGKRYRNLPTFVRHLEKPSVHRLKIGEEL